MIAIDLLRGVRRIVVHANCADGHASALILHDALPDAEVIAVAYDTPEHRDLVAEPGLLFCDMTPPRARVAEFVDVGAIVLDHHKGAADIVAAFGERGVFADEKLEPGVSGAVLAYREVWSQFPGGSDRYNVYRLATLAGIRDTWLRSDPSWDPACELSAGLIFIPLAELLDRHLYAAVSFAARLGQVLMEKRRTEVMKAVTSVVRFEVAGRRVAVIPDITLTSDVCDMLGPSVDIVAAFAYQHVDDGRSVRLVWSLRSHAGVDVSAIAKRFGGGGHTAAAGFSEEVFLPGVPGALGAANPYVRLNLLLGVALGEMGGAQ